MGQQAHVQLALWEWSKLCKCTYRRAWPPGDLHTQPGTPAAGVILSKVHMTKVTPSLGTAGSASCKVSTDLSPPPKKALHEASTATHWFPKRAFAPLNFSPLNFLPLYLSMSCTSFQILPPSSSSAKIIPHSSHPHNTSPHPLYTHSNCQPYYSWTMWLPSGFLLHHSPILILLFNCSYSDSKTRLQCCSNYKSVFVSCYTVLGYMSNARRNIPSP